MGEKNEQERLGLIQVYMGSGKGKTTAALGLALRAAGNRMRTYIGQFLKGTKYGELEGIKFLAPYVTLEQYGSPGWVLEQGGTQEQRDAAAAGLARAVQVLRNGEYDIVVLDEVNVAIELGLLDLEKVLTLIDERPAHVELVLTGRQAPQSILDRADLVTELMVVRHPFQRGVPARAGIVF